MKQILAFILPLFLSTAVQAKVVNEEVDYRHDQVTLKGFLAYDDSITGKRPGVLVVHEWWGLNDYAKMRAKQLAGLGYVALAADMYGGGDTTRDPKVAAKLSDPFKNDKTLMRQRAAAALQIVSKNKFVDPSRMAAIGFCFGGTTVIELAYSGADLAGVVSFHGSLPLPKPEDTKNIKAKILVLHGADDPHVTEEDIKAFQQAMRQAGADWEMNFYGKAVHAFSNPDADKAGIPGVAYNPEAAYRSWENMKMFFEEIFHKR
jgi:dienelactone hydrolase